MLCTSEDGIAVVTSTIKKVKERCADIHVIGAASNVSFNLPMRKYVNQGFIILALQAGMDSSILDPLNKDMRGLIYAAEALLGQDEFFSEMALATEGMEPLIFSPTIIISCLLITFFMKNKNLSQKLKFWENLTRQSYGNPRKARLGFRRFPAVILTGFCEAVHHRQPLLPV